MKISMVLILFASSIAFGACRREEQQVQAPPMKIGAPAAAEQPAL